MSAVRLLVINVFLICFLDSFTRFYNSELHKDLSELKNLVGQLHENNWSKELQLQMYWEGVMDYYILMSNMFSLFTIF